MRSISFPGLTPVCPLGSNSFDVIQGGLPGSLGNVVWFPDPKISDIGSVEFRIFNKRVRDVKESLVRGPDYWEWPEVHDETTRGRVIVRLGHIKKKC